MKPYILMHVKSDFTVEKLFYSNLSSDVDRNNLKEDLKKGGHLYCNCLYPKSKLELYITEKNRIIPKHHDYQHDDSCPKSQISKTFAPYNSAFKRDEKNENIIHANVNLSFTHKLKNENKDVHEHNIYTTRQPVKNAKMTVSALIKKLNMSTFQYLSFSKKLNMYPSIDEFCRWLNWKTKFIYIDKDKNLKSLSIENDKKAFFYGIYNKFEDTSDKYMQICLTRYYSSKEGKCFNQALKLSYKKEYFQDALEEFEKTYNNMSVQNAIENGYNIICSGFYTKNAKGYSTCLDLHFILVNKNGLFSESTYEADMYDYVCDYLNTNNLKSKYAFYKPWEFGSTIYNNNYLEDGIFYNIENDEQYALEVFGRNSPEYLETKTHKESIASDILISWNAAQNDPKPDLSQYLK